MEHRGLNQMLAAAVISERFRKMLLHHPARAIAAGYADFTFSLTSEEQALVVGVRAERLEDFAAEVYRWVLTNGRDRSLVVAGQPLGAGRVAGKYPEPVLDLAHIAAAA